MKRPIIFFAIFQITGIILAYILNSYIINALVVFLFFVIFSLIVKTRDILKILQIALLFFLIGSMQCVYTNKTNTAKFTPYFEKTITVYGTIDSEPSFKPRSTSYTLKTAYILEKGITKKVSGKILLTTTSDTVFNYGANVKASGKLQLPRGQTNLKGFDYQKYLYQKGIYASLFCPNPNIIAPDSFSLNHSGFSRAKNVLMESGLFVRNKIIHVINTCLPKNQAGLLNGILIGYREGLDKKTEKNFSDAGLTHIMAVSGANVAFIVIPLFFLFKKLRFSDKLSNILLIGTLIFFTYITGFEPSVLRAVAMAITVLIGNLLRREQDIISSISFASIILLIANPNMLFNIGFQLSFAATLSLIFLTDKVSKGLKLHVLPKFLEDTISATLAAQIGVLPITVYYFNKISFLSIFANILVVPAMGIVTCIGFIMAIIGQLSIFIASIIGTLNSSLLTFTLYVTKTTANLPYSVITVVTPSILAVSGYYTLLLYFIFREKIMDKLPKITPKIVIFTTCTLILLITTIKLFIPNKLEIVFIDVGQGDSALIKTAEGKNILIDGGGKEDASPEESNIGDTVVVPFLLDYGVYSLDAVIASHAHADHIQGLFSVLEALEVKNLLLPIHNDTDFRELKNLAVLKGVPINTCAEGDIIHTDASTYFIVFHPDSNYINDPNVNNRSLTLKLVYKNFTALFTGDIEKDIEKHLVEKNLPISSVLLKAPHHGSTTSSSEQFLKKIAPDISAISVGENNKFGHPSNDVIHRLESINSKMYRTDKCGAILVKSDGKAYWIKTIR